MLIDFNEIERTVEESTPPSDEYHVIYSIAQILQLDKELILSSTRVTEYVFARHLIAYILKTSLGWTYKRIGLLLNKDHSTAMNSIKKINNLIETNDVFGQIATKVINQICV